METFDIQIEESESKGRAFLDTRAEMTYSKARDGLIIIDHNEVEDSLAIE